MGVIWSLREDEQSCRLLALFRHSCAEQMLFFLLKSNFHLINRNRPLIYGSIIINLIIISYSFGWFMAGLVTIVVRSVNWNSRRSTFNGAGAGFWGFVDERRLPATKWLTDMTRRRGWWTHCNRIIELLMSLLCDGCRVKNCHLRVFGRHKSDERLFPLIWFKVLRGFPPMWQHPIPFSVYTGR